MCLSGTYSTVKPAACSSAAVYPPAFSSAAERPAAFAITSSRKFRCVLSADGKSHFLGNLDTAIEAAVAYALLVQSLGVEAEVVMRSEAEVLAELGDAPFTAAAIRSAASL